MGSVPFDCINVNQIFEMALSVVFIIPAVRRGDVPCHIGTAAPRRGDGGRGKDPHVLAPCLSRTMRIGYK